MSWNLLVWTSNKASWASKRMLPTKFTGSLMRKHQIDFSRMMKVRMNKLKGDKKVIRRHVKAEKQESCSGLPANNQTEAHTKKNPMRMIVRMMFQYF